MKLSVSLPNSDVDFLDRYATAQGIVSRSAALHRAVRLLQASELTSEYEQAWDEWAESGESQLWNSTVGDGLSDATR